MAGKAIVYTSSAAAAVALDNADQSYRDDKYHKEMDIEVTRRQNLGQRTLTFNEYNEMQDNIRKHHLPFLSRVSQTLPWVKKK